jgi:hypothetical protein
MHKLFCALLITSALAANAQMVAPRSSAPSVLIAAAGSLPGANGTYFRSDATILNYRNSAQRVQLQWLPQGGGTASPAVLTLNAHSGINSEDFVASVLHQSGLGAIVITGQMADGTFDPNAQLFATSRIWTPQPNATSGTNSQQFNGLPMSEVNSSTLSLVGHRREDRYRTNVGIVNLDTTVQTYRVDVLTSAGTETQLVIVAPQSLGQVTLFGASSVLPLQILVTNASSSTPRSTLWMAYGSSIDNVTGDAWSSLGFTQPVPAP